MRIELTWPRPEAADRTVAVTLPDVAPVAALLRPALHHARRMCHSGAVRDGVALAAPLIGGAARATGAGALVQLALPLVVRLAAPREQEPGRGGGAAPPDSGH